MKPMRSGETNFVKVGGTDTGFVFVFVFFFPFKSLLCI